MNHRRVIKPFLSIGQLLDTYNVSQIILEIRKNREEEDELLLSLPEISKIKDIEKLTDEQMQMLTSNYNAAIEFLSNQEEFIYTLWYAIEDMIRFNFNEQKSVTSNNIDIAYVKDTVGVEALAYIVKNVNLLQHTLNVFEEANEILRKRGNATGYEAALIAALIHDFGKSPEIVKILNKNISEGDFKNKQHAEFSEQYVRNMLHTKVMLTISNKYARDKDKKEKMQNFEAFLDQIAIIVRDHHQHADKHKLISVIKFVKDADIKARQKEQRQLKEKIY